MAARSTFLPTCLLLLIGNQPDHGYGLVRRLKQFGFADTDPGRVYRALRQLEGNGALSSDWRATGSGPARRTYRLTEQGEETLSERIAALRELQADIARVLAHHDEGARTGEPPPGAVPVQRTADSTVGFDADLFRR